MYWGRSKVNNNTPRSVTNPPPWANLDPRVLSPIPDKKKREDRWDGSFFRGNSLQRNSNGGSSGAVRRVRPASAGARRRQHDETRGGSILRSQESRKRRPASARERDRGGAYESGRKSGGIGDGDSDAATARNNQNRPPAFGAIRQRGPAEDHACCSAGVSEGGGNLAREKNKQAGGGTGNNNRGSSRSACFVEEREILAGGYRLNDEQESTFREFVTMLVDFDTCSTVQILDDVFREAQLATGLQDFTGCGSD